MKLNLPASVPITYFPTIGDDTREQHTPLASIGSITLPKGESVNILMSEDGRGLELHHSDRSIVIVDMNDVIASIVNATFNSINANEVKA